MDILAYLSTIQSKFRITTTQDLRSITPAVCDEIFSDLFPDHWPAIMTSDEDYDSQFKATDNEITITITNRRAVARIFLNKGRTVETKIITVSDRKGGQIMVSYTDSQSPPDSAEWTGRVVCITTSSFDADDLNCKHKWTVDNTHNIELDHYAHRFDSMGRPHSITGPAVTGHRLNQNYGRWYDHGENISGPSGFSEQTKKEITPAGLMQLLLEYGE